MKNQETIFAIKHDIATLENNIIIREAFLETWSHMPSAIIDKAENIRDTKVIAKLKKTLAKLEKEDRKTWKESLAIAHAHGGICSWWIENWGWVLIGGITVVSTVAFVLWRAL
jgi:triacylglycerol esterase/lipase EstA (alpha/beta hydrolase family)